MTTRLRTCTYVGTLDHGVVGEVDERGTVAVDDVAISWWIDAGPRRHDARSEVAVRQRSVADAPVTETLMRVGTGDVIARAFAVADDGGIVVLEFENTTKVPGALGLVVRGRDPRVEGSSVFVDGRACLTVDRPLADLITGDGTCTVIVPLPHGATVRAVTGAVPSRGLPDAELVAKGWRTQLQRGMQVSLPDARWQSAATRARAQVLLAGIEAKPEPNVVAALEDWGFDDEAEAVWERLGFGARRAAAQRPVIADDELVGRINELATTADAGALPDPAGLLLALRMLLVRDLGKSVDLLVPLPAGWRGGSVEVMRAPTRAGLVSFAVRWHGERPALLWECDQRIALRASALDPKWSTVEPRGEALLAQ